MLLTAEFFRLSQNLSLWERNDVVKNDIDALLWDVL